MLLSSKYAESGVLCIALFACSTTKPHAYNRIFITVVLEQIDVAQVKSIKEFLSKAEFFAPMLSVLERFNSMILLSSEYAENNDINPKLYHI